MKKILFMIIGLMFAAQAAFASPMGDRMNLETLNKSDAQVLFQDNAMSQHVVVLNEGQMKALKGMSWWTRFRDRVVHGVSHTVSVINDVLSHIKWPKPCGIRGECR